MDTQVSGVSRWLTLNNVPLRFGRGEDNVAAGAQEYGRNLFRVVEGAPHDLTIHVEGRFLNTAYLGLWEWRPAGFAGLYEVTVTADNSATYRTHVRVLPSHLSRRRHEAMLKEISGFSADLLFQLHSPAGEQVSPEEIERRQSPLNTYTLVSQMMDALALAVGQIARSPHRALAADRQRRRWDEVSEFSAAVSPVPGPTVQAPIQRPGLPAAWPMEWTEERRTLSYDVYENRLLKHFLQRQLLPRLDELEQRAEAEIARRQNDLYIARQRNWKETAQIEERRIAELVEVVDSCRAMQRQTMRWVDMPFLKAVHSQAMRAVPTQILQKHLAYSRFYAVYLAFQRELKRGLSTEGFLTTIATRKMSELYEIWTALRLAAMVTIFLRRAGYTSIGDHGFFHVDDEFFHFNLDKNAAIEMVNGGKRVVIRYQPTYPSRVKADGIVTDRRGSFRTPDMAVELWQDKVAQAILIFDAKYKAFNRAGKKYPDDNSINKMWDYASAIVWKSGGGVRRNHLYICAYALYPGDVVEFDPEDTRAGALPLVPDDKETANETRSVVARLLREAEII